MRRLAEYIGQSYFDYLASLDDLVILMDEAHRYHADASKKAINELRPILGLEMTATPTDEKGKLNGFCRFHKSLLEKNLTLLSYHGFFVFSMKNEKIVKFIIKYKNNDTIDKKQPM